MNTRLVVIDPDELERLRLSRALEGRGFQVIDSPQLVVGLVLVLREEPLAVLLSEEIPPLSAEEFIPLLRRLSDAPIVLIGAGDDEDEIDALERGADVYIRKPINHRLLAARLMSVIRRRSTSTDVLAPHEDLQTAESQVLTFNKTKLAGGVAER